MENFIIGLIVGAVVALVSSYIYKSATEKTTKYDPSKPGGGEKTNQKL